MWQVLAAKGLEMGLSRLLGSGDRKRERRRQQDADRYSRMYSEREFEERARFHDEAIQTRVADAQKAGIHPLYAMGGGSNFSPAQVFPGQASTGTHMGDSISGISDAVSTHMMARKEEKRHARHESRELAEQRRAGRLTDAQIKLLEAQTAETQAAAAVRLSKIRRAVGEAQTTGQPAPGGTPPDLVKSYRAKRVPRETRAAGNIAKRGEFSSGQELEDEHGEFIGGVKSILNWIAESATGHSENWQRIRKKAQRYKGRRGKYIPNSKRPELR